MTDKLKSIRERFKGLIAPIPGVFDGNGEPDLPMMEQLAEWYIRAGVQGFFVLGSQGQGAACRLDQRKAIAETVVRAVNGRVPVTVQIGAVDPYSSIELGQHARDVGADAVAIVGPYYYSDRNEWELIEHFKMVDKAVDMPILLYNNPQYSGYPCPPAMMAKLREAMPNVFGAKLANGNIGQAARYLQTLSRDFAVFMPINNMLPGMLIGVRGSIAAGAPVTIPEIGVKFIEAINNNDMTLALKIQKLLLDFEESIIPIRSYGRRTTLEGLRIRGHNVKEYPRWPTKPMTAEHQKLFREHMEKLIDDLASLTGIRAAAAE